MKNRFQNIILRRCNELAIRARGLTATNPNVGAIVVDQKSNKILGEGWHKIFGGPHAEVNAINKAMTNHPIAGKTLAVSLEPCNHSGKTAACTGAILKQELSEVWVDQIDPDDKMKGQSLEILRNTGLTVPPPKNLTIGKKVIYPFEINTRLKRPYLTLKMALSQDGFIGQNGKQVKISGQISNRWVHRLRYETQAIMAGTNTLLNDNPSLTSRYGNQYQPIRILPDRRGILPGNLNVFKQPSRNIILTSSDRTDYLGDVIKTDPHDLQNSFWELYKHNIGTILIEGGSSLFNSLLAEHLWDELILIQNNNLQLKHGIKAPSFPSITLFRQIKLGADTLFFLKNPVSR